jgi:hypothetical protein
MAQRVTYILRDIHIDIAEDGKLSVKHVLSLQNVASGEQRAFDTVPELTEFLQQNHDRVINHFSQPDQKKHL